MSTRSLVIAGAVLIFLASYYICFEMRYSPGIQRWENKGEKLLVFDRKEIIGMTIKGSSYVALEKSGSGWQITGPVHSPADQAGVNNLISEISNMRIHRTLTEEGGLNQFGLEHPSLEITLRTTGRKFNLSIGCKAPASEFYYAKTSVRSGIFLISARERQYLVDQNLFTLRDKHLASEDFARADRVRITRGSMIIEYIRDREDIWRFSSDTTKRIKASRVNEFIREACSTEALGYHEGMNASRAPDIILELFYRESSQKIKLWESGGKAYFASDLQEGMVEIDPSFVERMPDDPMEMLDRTIASLDDEKVINIVLSGRETMTFTKKPNGWYTASGKKKDSIAVKEFINSLGTLEYQDEYLMLPKDAVREQVIRITCTGSSAPFDITVYSKYYVTVGKRIFRINEGVKKILVESVHSLLREDT